MRIFAVIAMLFISVLFIGANSTSVSAQESDKKSKKVTIKSGDTLSKIAKKNKTTYVRIFNANKKIKNPNLIYPGDKVRIPGPKEKLKKRALPGSSTSSSRSSSSSASSTTSQSSTSSRSTSSASTSRSYRPAPSPSRNTSSANVNGGVWDRIAQCESGGNWSINTGNGYYGGVQFTLSSWRAAGGTGYPHHASKSEQIKRAKILQSMQGWGAWPACTSKLGIR